MNQTQENGKKPHFGPDLDLFGANSDRQFFFIKPVIRQCSKCNLKENL